MIDKSCYENPENTDILKDISQITALKTGNVDYHKHKWSLYDWLNDP